MNRYYPTNVETLRESQRRAFDSSASASMLSELIDKHGRNDWLDPVMDNLGPYIQLQLGGTSKTRSDNTLIYILLWVPRHLLESNKPIAVVFVTPF